MLASRSSTSRSTCSPAARVPYGRLVLLRRFRLSRRRRPNGSTISFVTATVLIAFDEARHEGIAVPQKLVDRGLASILRQRKPDFSYDYGEYLKYVPMMPINRPGGSLGRSQACNLAMRLWGDKKVTDADHGELARPPLRPRDVFDMGRKRPIPHESWFQVAGWFFYYGHYYASSLHRNPSALATARAAGPSRSDSSTLAAVRRHLVGFSFLQLSPGVWDGVCGDDVWSGASGNERARERVLPGGRAHLSRRRRVTCSSRVYAHAHLGLGSTKLFSTPQRGATDIVGTAYGGAAWGKQEHSTALYIGNRICPVGFPCFAIAYPTPASAFFAR